MTAISGRARRAGEWATRLVDIGPLVVLRLAFGLLMLAATLRFMARGWIHDLYVAPEFHFTYTGFGWVRPLPEWGLWLVFVGLAVCALGVALGLAYRLSMAGFFVLFTYVELLDKATYLNHYYFVSLLSFLLIWLPLNGRYALDNRLPETGLFGKNPVSTVPAWMVGIVRLQLGLVYFFAGLAKLNADWLLAAQPLTIWLHARTGTPLIGRWFDHAWPAYVMSWAGALFDLTIPFWLSWRRTRRPAYLAVIVFHGLTGLLFNIGMFPWIMIACTLVFFDWKVGERDAELRGVERRYSAADSSVAVYLALFILLQLLLPLRHWLYPGDVNWTEEGGRFAWRVMLVEKAGQATFFVRDGATGRETVVLPGDYLTELQEQQMAWQPDMIVQFAHYLGRRTPGAAAVRAEVYVSWNGRPSRLLIDPQANLLHAGLSPLPKSWILREETADFADFTD